MRQEILHTATDLFLNLGFKSVTMDDIAGKMGISKKTIYAHFKNKTKLVEETTMNMFKEISNKIDQIAAEQKNPIEELYEIKRCVMEHLKNEKVSPHFQLQKYYPNLFSTLKEKQFEVMQNCVVDNIERGLKMGIYRPDLNIEFISRIYFYGATIIKDQKLFPLNLFSAEELMGFYLEYHLRGIVTPLGRKKLNEIINSNQD